MVDAHGRFCFLFFLFVVLAKSNGLVTLGRFVQDPLPVEPFNVTTTSPRLSVCFWNLRLHGLARTLLWTAEANLIEPLVKVATVTDVVSLQGEYKLDGGSALVSFISVGGEGQFRMNATNVSTVATATFEEGPNGRPRVRDVDVRLELKNIKFHMENLMGGGRLARAEESLHTTVRENIRQRINSELSRISVERSESLVDGLIALVGEQIRTMGADPFKIANQHHSFKQDLLFFTVHCEAHLTGGRLHGLSTVQRSGNLMAYYKDRTVTIDADLEFRQLSGTFRWRARVQGSRFSGRVSLAVSGVALHLRLTLPVGDNVTVAGPLHLEELELTDVGQVRLHFHGVDSLDFLLEVLTNLIIDNIKRDLAHVVLELLEDAIRRSGMSNRKVKHRTFLVALAKSEGLVSLGRFLRDPLPVAPFNVTTRSTLATIRGRFWNLRLVGLSGTRLRQATANLTGQTVEVTTITDVVSLQGEYKLNGDFAFLSLRGEGQFWMNATNAVASARAVLEKGPDGGPRVREVDAKLEVGDIKLHMENLMGGGGWSSFSNSLLNQISGTVFKQAQKSLRSELQGNIRKQMNLELSKIPIRAIGADPFSVPDQNHSFQQDLLFLTAHGEAHLTEGRLYGLSSVKRAGDLLALYQDRRVLFEADLEFGNLTGAWKWWVQLLGAGPSGVASLLVKGLALHLRLSLPVGDDVTVGPLQLEALELRDVGQIWLDVHGMGSFDFLVEVFANLVSNAMKWQIAEAVLVPIADAIRHEIATLPLPEFL
ncbi:hypothetical protein HPB47_004259 [Ixodes persulcatus]|uniref:Uncharacterized protein n=1 Tax=Ixodes persulcatus TaxID=34615 RepID=A0AC60PGC8_IXOPE|nr:hypothetical protein HPB47_004259 [Ixodes persulcatus]